MVMVTDESMIEWYMKGFNDELSGTSSLMSKHKPLNIAYNLGALDAEFGDDDPKLDYCITSENILNKIKQVIANGK